MGGSEEEMCCWDLWETYGIVDDPLDWYQDFERNGHVVRVIDVSL